MSNFYFPYITSSPSVTLLGTSSCFSSDCTSLLREIRTSVLVVVVVRDVDLLVSALSCSHESAVILLLQLTPDTVLLQSSLLTLEQSRVAAQRTVQVQDA